MLLDSNYPFRAPVIFVLCAYLLGRRHTFNRAYDRIRPIRSGFGRLPLEVQFDLVKLHTLGIGQTVAFGGAGRSIRAFAIRVREGDQFSPPIILDQLVIFDFLGPDNFAVRTIVLKLELHVFACVGADLWRRRFCDKVGDSAGLDVGFEFRKRKRKRAQDESCRDRERNSFHCFAPCYEPERGRHRKLAPPGPKISASRAFGRINVIAERRRSAVSSTSTGGRRENMSRLFFCFRSCDCSG